MLDRAPHLCVTVVGPAALEQVLVCRPRRRLRAGVPPWLEVVTRDEDGGGAAAAALALSALGARVRLVTAVGEDREAERLRSLLLAAGISDADVVAGPAIRTATTSRLTTDHRVVARFDEPSGTEPDAGLVAQLARRVRTAAADSEAVLLVTDPAHTALPGMTAACAPAAADHPCLVVTGAPPDAVVGRRPRMVLLDSEAATALVTDEGLGAALPASSERARWLASRATELRDRSGASAIAVSLGGDGAVVLTEDAVLYTPPGPTPRGRQDPLRSAWAPAATVALAAGHDVLAATHLAAATADVPRRGPRSAPVDLELIREAVRRRRPPLPLATGGTQHRPPEP